MMLGTSENDAIPLDGTKESDLSNDFKDHDGQNDLTELQTKQLLKRAELRIRNQTTNIPQTEVRSEKSTSPIFYK